MSYFISTRKVVKPDNTQVSNASYPCHKPSKLSIHFYFILIENKTKLVQQQCG